MKKSIIIYCWFFGFISFALTSYSADSSCMNSDVDVDKKELEREVNSQRSAIEAVLSLFDSLKLCEGRICRHRDFLIETAELPRPEFLRSAAARLAGHQISSIIGPIVREYLGEGPAFENTTVDLPWERLFRALSPQEQALIRDITQPSVTCKFILTSPSVVKSPEQIEQARQTLEDCLFRQGIFKSDDGKDHRYVGVLHSEEDLSTPRLRAAYMAEARAEAIEVSLATGQTEQEAQAEFDRKYPPQSYESLMFFKHVIQTLIPTNQSQNL